MDAEFTTRRRTGKWLCNVQFWGEESRPTINRKAAYVELAL